MAGEVLSLTLALLLKDSLSGRLGGIQKTLGGLGTAVLGAAGVAVGGIAVMAGKVLEFGKLAAAEEEGVVKLSQAVKNTGADWKTASEDIESYLTASLKRTALDDGAGREAIQTLTEATGDYKKSLDLMAITQDLARAKDMDLATAAALVGKVANGNVGVLKKYGITLDEGATSSEAFAAMQKKFGGQAEAFAKTNAGAQQQLNIAMGNLKETIGGAVLPIMSKLAEKGADLAQKALPFVEAAVAKLGPVFQGVFGFIGDNVVPILEGLFAGLQSVFVFIEENKTAILLSLGGIAIAIGVTLIPAFIAWAAAAGAAAIATMVALAPIVLPIVLIGAAVALLVTAWDKDWGGIRTKLTEVWERGIKPAFEAIVTFLTVTLPDGLKEILRWFTETWTKIKTFITETWEAMLLAVVTVFNTITGFIRTTLENLRKDMENKWAEIKQNVVTFLNAVWEAIKLMVKVLYDAVIQPYVDAYNYLFGPGGTIPKAIVAIGKFLADAEDVLKGMVKALYDAVIQPWADAYNELFGPGGTIPKAIAAIGEFLADAEEVLGEKLGDVRDAVTAPFTAAKSFLFDEPNGIFPGIKEKIVTAWGSIKTWLGGACADMKNAFTKPFEQGYEAIKGLLWKILGFFGITPKETTVPPPTDTFGAASGLSATFASPTRILVGERGPERVTVTPLTGAGVGGQGSGASYTLNYTAVRAEAGYDDAVKAMRRLEWLARMRYRTT
jgi:hypothetical protein